MSWVNDLCKSIKSKCWCWCQCICCPNGDVHTDNDDDKDIPSSMSSSRLENKIKEFYNSLPNTPSEEKNQYFIEPSQGFPHLNPPIDTLKTPVIPNQTAHTLSENSAYPPVYPSKG